MSVIGTDVVATNKNFAVNYSSSPETHVIKAGVLVYLYSLDGSVAAVKDDGFDGAKLYNYGSVIGDGYSNGVYFAATGCALYNAADAEITGGSSGVTFAGSGARVSNLGRISSSGGHSILFGDGGRLDNSGELNGDLGATAGTTSVFLRNFGAINGSSYLLIDGKPFAFNRIEYMNYGTINGSINVTYRSGDSSVSLLNSGKITGFVSLAGTGDTFDNRGGHVAGDVSLGDGADTFDNRGGRVDGVVSGGGGNDTYIVDGTPLTIEEGASGGTDTLQASSVSLDLARYSGIENVQLLGTLNLSATGDAGANMLTGNAGRNVLKGLAGSDVYVVQNASDQVIEAAGGGTDTVIARASYALGAGQSVERLTADPVVGAVNLTGNEFGQILTGNAGVNVLDGKGGVDTLIGGGGKDTFVFSTALAAANVDRVKDFSVADDTVQLAKSVFAALAAGSLNAAAFKNVGAAGASVDASDRILYDSRTGTLAYDPDGSGKAAAVTFAIVENKVGLTAADFFVV